MFQLVSSRYETRSIITVRHPLDFYLSLANKAWLHFQPQNIDEYSRRCLQFLDDHSDLKVFRYGDLTESAPNFMEQVCLELDLSYSPNFEQLLGAFELSGDSGRKSNLIRKRTRRAVPKAVAIQLQSSKYFEKLCARLGYQM